MRSEGRHERGARPEPKARAAALSVASNATLITLKVIAGIATGSVAVLTEAAHSGIDLVASIVAFVSVRKAAEPAAQRGVVAFHKLRARQAGSRRYVDVHLQFEDPTTLEAAQATAHKLTNAIRDRLSGADILVHVEPGDRIEPGTEIGRPPAAPFASWSYLPRR